MKPFLQGKKTLSLAPLRPPHAHIHRHPPDGKAPQAPATGAFHPGWSVDVIKEGDKVTRINVTCVCGERTEITCLYPAGE
jgi:hypothetical protein